MMKNVILFACLLLFISCQQEDRTTELMSIVKEVQNEYRPDKRVGIFDVDIKKVDAIYVAEGKSSIFKAEKALSERFKALGVIVGDKIEHLPSKSLKGKNYGIVNVSVCNMRSKGKHSAELGTQALLGMPLKILYEKDGWYRVQNKVDNYLGWLDPGAFYPLDVNGLKTYNKKDKVVYTKEYGFVLSRDDDSHISDITAGGIVVLDGQKEDYFMVQLPDGRLGRIAKIEAMEMDDWRKENTFTVENFIATAKKFMGTPYVWGGTSPKGMDCSGFTKTAAYLNGTVLARDASQQVHQGTEVKTDTTLVNLQRGDLLFFGKKATKDKKARITHVAIYLGDGRILHDSGKVKIESLKRGDKDFNEGRLHTLVTARRMVGDTKLKKVLF